VVAVVDTGVDYTHKELAANIWTNPGETGGGKESNDVDDDGNGYVDDWRGWNFGLGTNDPIDAVGHGTHVAGTIGAVGDNGTGVAGVNWDVQIMPLRVADANGVLSDAGVAAAFAYAGRMGARVVNARLGGNYTSSAELAAINGAPGHALRRLRREREPEHQEHGRLAVHASGAERPLRRGHQPDGCPGVVLELRPHAGRHRRAGRQRPEHAAG